MKRLCFLIIFSLFLLIGLTSKATTTTISDNDLQDDNLVNPGSIPGDFFYSFDRFFEDVSIKLSFKDEKKIEKYVRYAEERLAEINQLNPEENLEWMDQLYDDYGMSLKQANDLLTDVISKGKLKAGKLEKLQIRIERVTTKEELINSKAKGKINTEVKEKVKELKVETYLTTMSEELTDEERDSIINKNIKGKDIIKLKSLSQLSGLSIDEIMELDIFMPDDPVSKVREMEIDYNKLETVLEIEKEQLIEDLKDYHKALNQNRKAEKEQEKADKDKGKSEEEREEIKEEAKKRKEEAEKRREEIEKKIKDKINNGNGNGRGNGN